MVTRDLDWQPTQRVKRRHQVQVRTERLVPKEKHEKNVEKREYVGPSKENIIPRIRPRTIKDERCDFIDVLIQLVARKGDRKGLD